VKNGGGGGGPGGGPGGKPICHGAPAWPKGACGMGGICGGMGGFSLRLRFQRRASLLGPPGRKGKACGFRFSSFISAAGAWWRAFAGEMLSRRPTAVLSRLVSENPTGEESWGLYRVDATVDMGQKEERGRGRGEEVGEVRCRNSSHEASAALK
jgi:hypothetical protein